MTTYLIEVDGVTPVTNPDGSVTLPITPKVPASSIAAVTLLPIGNNVSVPVPNAQVGDHVSYIAIVNGRTSAGGPLQDLSTFFESTISVAGHIQQLDPLSVSLGDGIALLVLTRDN